MRYKTFLLFITSLPVLFLNACATTNISEKNDMDYIEGSWIDAHGLVSNFHNGMMQTQTPDTQEKLAEGNYIFTAPGQLKIELRSLVQGKVSIVNCTISRHKEAIYCRGNNNSNFSLSKAP